MILGKKELVEHFKQLGIKQGMILEVHSSLSSFGYVVGGAQTVVDALIEVIGYNGTLLMPFQCATNSDPSTWIDPQCDPNDISAIRKRIPAFNYKESDLYKMGSIVENLRRRDGVIVSPHPNRAYIAWGKYSKLLCNYQSSNFAFSMESPAARLKELKGYILLLGIDYDNISSLHLAEYCADCAPISINCAACNHQGFRKYEKFLDIEYDEQVFCKVGQQLEQLGYVNSLKIGDCQCRLLPFDIILDYTIKYIKKTSIVSLYR